MLNDMPEKSRWVPSSLKCRVHHCESVVVAAATAVPRTSSTTDMIASWRESTREPRKTSTESNSVGDTVKRRDTDGMVEDIGSPLKKGQGERCAHKLPGRAVPPSATGNSLSPG